MFIKAPSADANWVWTTFTDPFDVYLWLGTIGLLLVSAVLLKTALMIVNGYFIEGSTDSSYVLYTTLLSMCMQGSTCLA